MEPHGLMVLVLKATAVLALGTLVASALRRASASVRHVVWMATLLSLLALPLLGRVALLPLPVLPSPSSAPVMTAPAALADMPSAAAPAQVPPEPIVPRVLSPAPSSAITIPTVLLSLHLTVAAGILAWFAIGAFSVRRIVRAATPLENDRWSRRVFEIADRLGLREPPGLVVSRHAVVPFATGLRHATVVLPAHAIDWPDDRADAVLVHELAHVRRRDVLARALARVACAAWWFHPLAWVAARRLHLESERACDDLVLACGARPSDYAGFLLDVLTSSRRAGAPATAVAMARRTELEGRVLAVLDADTRRGRPKRAQSASLVAALTTAFAVVALVDPVARARADEPPAPPARIAPPAEEVVPADERAAAQPPSLAPSTAPSPAAARQQAPSAAGATTQRHELLARALRSDPAPVVRRTAAWALGQEPEPASVPLLVSVLRGDAEAEVREMAAWALGQGDLTPEAVAALADVLRRDESAEVRETAAWALGQSNGGEVDALVAAVEDRAPGVRRLAIWAIGQRSMTTVPDAVVSALRDEDAEVRQVAAWALSEIGDRRVQPALLEAFRTESVPEVREVLFRALVLDEPVPREVIALALRSGDPEIRARGVVLDAGVDLGPWPWPWPWPQPRPQP